MSSKQEHRVTVDSGKYTFVVPADDYRVVILRHGEPWHEQGEASNALHAMMCELDAARLVVAQARALGQDWRSGDQARLERAIQQHDALTGDRSPPSAWTGACDPPDACATHGRCWPHSEWDDPDDPALRGSVDMPDNFRRFNVVDLGTQISTRRCFAVWDTTVSRFWKINGHQTWACVGNLVDDFKQTCPSETRFQGVFFRQRDEIAEQALSLGFDQDL